MRSVVARHVMRRIPVIVAKCVHFVGLYCAMINGIQNVQLACTVVIGISWNCAGRLGSRTVSLYLNAYFGQGRTDLTNVYW